MNEKSFTILTSDNNASDNNAKQRVELYSGGSNTSISSLTERGKDNIVKKAKRNAFNTALRNCLAAGLIKRNINPVIEIREDDLKIPNTLRPTVEEILEELRAKPILAPYLSKEAENANVAFTQVTEEFCRNRTLRDRDSQIAVALQSEDPELALRNLIIQIMAETVKRERRITR